MLFQCTQTKSSTNCKAQHICLVRFMFPHLLCLCLCSRGRDPFLALTFCQSLPVEGRLSHDMRSLHSPRFIPLFLLDLGPLFLYLGHYFVLVFIRTRQVYFDFPFLTYNSTPMDCDAGALQLSCLFTLRSISIATPIWTYGDS
jgi:hypothetical protein